MNSDQFESVFEETVQKSREVLIEKAREYANDGDRLHNFVQAGYLGQETPAQALGGMMRKHTVSIYDMLKTGEDVYSLKKWDEKILDHINYLILLRALVIEKHETQQKNAVLYIPDDANNTIGDYMDSKYQITVNNKI